MTSDGRVTMHGGNDGFFSGHLSKTIIFMKKLRVLLYEHQNTVHVHFTFIFMVKCIFGAHTKYTKYTMYTMYTHTRTVLFTSKID